MRVTIAVVFCALLLLVSVSAPLPAHAACLATGKLCLVGGAYDDSLCCPGMVCGWGAVCQAGCNIGGQFYKPNFRNPNNSCQVCTPRKSTGSWTNTCVVEFVEPQAEKEVLVACMLEGDPDPSDMLALGTGTLEATP